MILPCDAVATHFRKTLVKLIEPATFFRGLDTLTAILVLCYYCVAKRRWVSVTANR